MEENKVKDTLLSVKVDFDIDEDFDSDSFIKLKLRLMHDGENAKGFNFSSESLEDALESIKNKPILANVVFDEDGEPQFGGHDRHIERDYKDEIRIIYDEMPIGLIPESAKLEIDEEFERNYIYAEAYVWKKYSNYARDIIERDKDIKLSVEISILEFTKTKNGMIDTVTKFVFDAVTLLGNERGTGMINAKATTKEEFECIPVERKRQQMNELIRELQNCIDKFSNKELEKGGGTLEVVDKVVLDNQEQSVENNVEKDDLNKDGECELTSSEKASMLHGKIRGAYSEFDGYVYMFDFDSKYVYFFKEIYENHVWKKTRYRIGYTMNDNEVTLADDETEVVVKILTKDEWDKLEVERENMQVQFEELKQFKENAIAEKRANDVKAIFDRFDEKLQEVDSYKALKEENANFSLDEIEEKCYAIVGRLGMSIKNEPKEETFENENKAPEIVATDNIVEESFEDEDSSYLNGILDDYYK